MTFPAAVGFGVGIIFSPVGVGVANPLLLSTIAVVKGIVVVTSTAGGPAGTASGAVAAVGFVTGMTGAGTGITGVGGCIDPSGVTAGNAIGSATAGA
jgi:hypothetical protein